MDPHAQRSSDCTVDARGRREIGGAACPAVGSRCVPYGDNIPAEPVANPGQDGWRARLVMARRWRDVVNRHGGDVTVVHLPEVGIRGNTHFPFSDLNNVEVANLLTEFLRQKKLD